MTLTVFVSTVGTAVNKHSLAQPPGRARTMGTMDSLNFGDPATFPGVVPQRGLWRRTTDAFRQEAMDFCLSTGLHGYKYIVQPGKHRAERLFWSVIVAVSMAAAVWLMKDAVEFNRKHPIILAVDTTHSPLWKVDAPGVTVCPSNKVLRSKAVHLVKSLILPADVTEDEIVSDIGLLVELVAPRATNTSRLARLQTILDKNSLSVDQAMRRVTPSCDELLVRCLWKRRQCVHCSDIFRLVPTAYGYCCSFNYMDRDLDKYKPRMGGCVGVAFHDAQRLSACGYTNGLSVTVRIQPDEYLSSFLASHAVMVMIHNPSQYPDGNADLKVVGAGTVSFISYLAQVTEATGRLRKKVAADIRKCHFPDETYLPMFRSYTFENCMASCQANRTLATCGCVPITYPQMHDRKVCNLLDTPCVSSLVSEPSPLTRSVINASMCPLCRPLCENVEYSVETSVGVLDFDYDMEGQPLTQGLGDDENEFAIFHVFANDLVTTMYKMDEYMTREDLLGSLGGLSGLFVGFSLVSGFEFVYFFTIRPFFRMRARQAASRSASRPPSMGAFDGSPPTGGPLGPPPGLSAASSPRHRHPFPLAAPHVFRFRRRGGDAGADKEERRDRQYRRNGGSISMIAVIE